MSQYEPSSANKTVLFARNTCICCNVCTKNRVFVVLFAGLKSALWPLGGSFDVSAIGLTAEFVFQGWEGEYKRRDAHGLIQAERYDRTSNLWTLLSQGLGSGPSSHFAKDTPYPVPRGSWARFDGVDFGAGGQEVSVVALAKSAADGAQIRFQLGSPDASGELLASLHVPTSATTFSVMNGTSAGLAAPAGVHSVFMVFNTPVAPPPPPPDDAPHRYWRLISFPGDFNHSFFNTNWDVCQIQLFARPAVRPNNKTRSHTRRLHAYLRSKCNQNRLFG